MIEIVKEKELEKQEEGLLPKNIRQIGEREKNKRIYMEDYVVTYLKQLRDTVREEQRVLILYGRKENIEYIPTWFVSGVLETDAQPFYEANLIDEHDWQEINMRATKYFPNLSVLGWAVIGQEDVTEYIDQIELTWRQFFREDQQLFFYSCISEMTEDLYCFEMGQLKRQQGFYIYYEKNENMQNYMLENRKQQEEGTDALGYSERTEVGNDHATRQFRSIVQEKKEELHRKRTMSFLYAASSILVMVIMVIGITMLNNYEKMENMENTLTKLSGQVEDGFAAKETAQQAAAMETRVEETTGEELANNVQTENTNADKRASDDGTTEGVAEENVTLQNTENLISEQNKTAQAADEITDEQSGTQALTQPEQQNTQETLTQPEQQSTQEAMTQPQQSDTAAEAAYTTYEIQKGDTLAKICIRFYGNEDKIQEICTLNQIKDKNTILYGQKILLP